MSERLIILGRETHLKTWGNLGAGVPLYKGMLVRHNAKLFDLRFVGYRWGFAFVSYPFLKLVWSS